MALIDKARWSLLTALTVATVVACGEPAGRSAPFRQATSDASPPKGGEPAGALPSLVVSGDVAAFQATSTNAGVPKSRDTTGSLPSSAATGRSAAYAPAGRAGAVGAQGQDGEGVTPPRQPSSQ